MVRSDPYQMGRMVLGKRWHVWPSPIGNQHHPGVKKRHIRAWYLVDNAWHEHIMVSSWPRHQSDSSMSPCTLLPCCVCCDTHHAYPDTNFARPPSLPALGHDLQHHPLPLVGCRERLYLQQAIDHAEREGRGKTGTTKDTTDFRKPARFRDRRQWHGAWQIWGRLCWGVWCCSQVRRRSVYVPFLEALGSNQSQPPTVPQQVNKTCLDIYLTHI